MSVNSIPLKRQVFYAAVLGWSIVKQAILVLLRKIQLMSLYLRRDVIMSLKDPAPTPLKPRRLLAVIPHIATEPRLRGSHETAAKVEKLSSTIDGLLNSFAHCELTIVISTLPDRHLTEQLPAYQRNCIQVLETPDCDPMHVGFRAQDEFVKYADHYDWFLFLEDDIIIHDSFLLEKLERFNQRCGDRKAVLLPNRYEICEGTKSYIDLTIDSKVAWNRLSSIEIEGVKHAECTNPHSGIYCLSQAQLQSWVKSGQRWKYQDLIVGPLESAATFCLLECFRLYKPHPANLNFLEVRHYDTKYSKLYPQASPYTLSPVRQSPVQTDPVQSGV